MGCGASSERQDAHAAATYQHRRASISHQLAGMGDEQAAMKQGFATELQCQGGSLAAKPGLSGEDFDEVVGALRSLSLFQHVPPKDLEEAARTRVHAPWHVPDGTVVLQEGDVAPGLASEGLFVLLSGAAQAVKYSEPWGMEGKVVWEYRVPTALQRSVSRSNDSGSEAWFGERTLIGPRAGAEGPNRGATVRAVGDDVRLMHINKTLWNKFYSGTVGLVVAHRALEQMTKEYDLLGGAGYADEAEILGAKIEWLAAEHELEAPKLQALATLRSESLRRDAPRQKLISKSELKEKKRARRASVEANFMSPTNTGTPGSTRSGRRASVVVGAEEMAGLLSPTRSSRAKGAKGGDGRRYVGGGERGRRRSVVADGTDSLGSGEGDNFDAAAAATKWAAERDAALSEAEARKHRKSGSKSSSSRSHHSKQHNKDKDGDWGRHQRHHSSSHSKGNMGEYHHHHHRSSSKSAQAPEEAESDEDDNGPPAPVVIGRSGRRRRSVV